MATRKTSTRKATTRRRPRKTATRRATTRRSPPRRATRKATRKPCKRCMSGGVRYVERKLGRSGNLGVWDRMYRGFVRMHANECKVLFGDDAHRWFEFLTGTERAGAVHHHRGPYEIFPATDGTWVIYHGRTRNIVREGVRSFRAAASMIARGSMRKAIRCEHPIPAPGAKKAKETNVATAKTEVYVHRGVASSRRARRQFDEIQDRAVALEMAERTRNTEAERFEREVEAGRRARAARSNPRRKGAKRSYHIVRRGWGWGY